ncbi:MAG TPA: FG-GAP-like repeat-containing protein, partial [Blastocatellia bacterium]|nr:FG-GAP-like repeat-containing protein [Blastocatellia bacterium]
MPLKPQRFYIRDTFKNTPRWILTTSLVLLLCLGIYGATHLSILRAQAADSSFHLEALSINNLHVKLEGQQSLKPEFIGDEIARNLLEQNQAQALALASADFDEDGMPDLVTGYGYSGGGVLSINRGNLAAAYRQSSNDRSRLESDSTERAPAFLSPGKVWSLTDSADFVAAGDFNADGHFDVVVGAKGTSELYLLAGNGKGQLAEAQKMSLPGRVTALVSGDVNRADELADLVVGLESDRGTQFSVYESPQGAWNAQPETFKAKQSVSGLSIGRINNDGWNDIAVAAGQELMVIQGRDRKLLLNESDRSKVKAATVQSTSFTGNVRALAIGSFADKRRSQVAVLLDSGAVYLASDKPVQTSAKRNYSRNPNTGLQSELYRDAGSSDSTGLLRAKVSSTLNDDLIVFGSGNRLEVLGRKTTSGSNASESAIENGNAVFELDSPISNALPMRLNGDALSDLVVLRQGASTPAFIESQPEATFTVTSNADNGTGTLRDAILNANRNPGADIILFSISSGSQTITVNSQLPAITEAVTIDGTSQPGFSGAPLIELGPSPSASPAFGPGLVVAGDGTTIRGLVIRSFTSYGILIFSSNNVIQGNYIGTDLTGTLAVPNGNSGILLDGSNQTVTNNLIGGTVAAARNVISGNSSNGVEITDGFSSAATFAEGSDVPEAASANTVQGNFIGVDASGTAALPNQFNGVNISNSTSNVIGGTTAGARNIISGNSNSGIEVFRSFILESTAGNLIQGNYIGLNAAGNSALPNNTGVFITGEDITVGGSTAAARNVISGNAEDGIAIAFNQATNNVIAGNFIGTDAAGTTAIGNGEDGIAIGEVDSVSTDSSNNLIGGTSTAAGNVIAFNGDNGVALFGGTGNAVL